MGETQSAEGKEPLGAGQKSSGDSRKLPETQPGKAAGLRLAEVASATQAGRSLILVSGINTRQGCPL